MKSNDKSTPASQSDRIFDQMGRGKATPASASDAVYLVATGDACNHLPTYTRHTICPPMADAETLYTHPAPASAEPAYDREDAERWRVVAALFDNCTSGRSERILEDLRIPFEDVHRDLAHYVDPIRPKRDASGEGQEGELLPALQRIATSLWEKHYREDAPEWYVFDYPALVLTQIDNMTAGLSRAAQQRVGVQVLTDRAFDEIRCAAEKSVSAHARKIRGQMLSNKDAPAWHYMQATLDWVRKNSAYHQPQEGAGNG